MPAYRSSAEADVRTAVVERLRSLRPDARIIHEINIDERKCRADVLAVTPTEIYAVEIKSERDKLDRLEEQAKSMLSVAHHVIAAVHDKHMPDLHYVSDVNYWIFPEAQRPVSLTRWYPATDGWRAPSMKLNTALPHGAISLLWRDELAEFCIRMGLNVSGRTVVSELRRLLWWRCSGEELTRGICAALRRRSCVEADPPIYPTPPKEDRT